jgi:hypothetical protein
MTDQVRVHKTWVFMQPVLPQEIKGGRGCQTCMAKQPKLFQEILKELNICVPVQPMVPQKIPKKPKTCVTSSNPEESQISEVGDSLVLGRCFEIALTINALRLIFLV